ncbi:MAG: hypothetical protein N2Z80_02570 [Hydrogenothermaceae bacterium]|nr:hypothetical protein [Hydrogenothermaceae bacterium]
MKKYLALIGIVSVLSSCGGSGGSNQNNINIPGSINIPENQILIKGRLSGLVGSRNESGGIHAMLMKIFPNAFASTSTIAKVLVFTQSGNFWVTNVNNGIFSVGVEKGTVVGLVFLDANNKFIGYLNLKKDLDSLPLTKLKSGVKEIDLKEIKLNGNTFTPSYIPLDQELEFSEDEKNSLEFMDDFFSSVVKNPDVDGNGVVDLMENKFYRLGILYFVKAGEFGNKLTPTLNQSVYINGFRLSFDAFDENRPQYVEFTGPINSDLNNAPSSQANTYPNSTTYFSPYIGYSPGSTGNKIPPSGSYTVSYKGRSFVFNIPDQSSAPSRIVIAVPTVTLNQNGTINKLNWVYKMPAGNSTLSPTAVIREIEVQIDGTGTSCSSYPQPNRIYNSGMLKPGVVEHTLSCQNINWQSVSRIHMSYNDVYGNHYVITWNK